MTKRQVKNSFADADMQKELGMAEHSVALRHGNGAPVCCSGLRAFSDALGFAERKSNWCI